MVRRRFDIQGDPPDEKNSIVVLALAASQFLIASPSQAAPAGYADPIIETSRLDNEDTRVRFVVPQVPAGIKEYRLLDRETNKRKKTCKSAAMRNGSGSKGCYITAGPDAYDHWVMRAVTTGGKVGPKTYVPISHLDADQGTIQVIWVKGDVKAAARTYQAVTRVFADQASGCAKDAAVTQAMKTLRKTTTKAALKSKSPYVAAASLLANGVAYYDKAAGFKNRCSAISGLVRNMASAIVNARKAKSPKMVYATSTWVRVDKAPDFCQVYSSGNPTNSRPPAVGGLNEYDCLHFWGAMVCSRTSDLHGVDRGGRRSSTAF